MNQAALDRYTLCAQPICNDAKVWCSTASVRKKTRSKTNETHKWLLAFSAATLLASAHAETAPDALVKAVVTDVTGVLKNDPGVLGNAAKLKELIEAKLLPNFNFGRMTQLAMGRNWAKHRPNNRLR